MGCKAAFAGLGNRPKSLREPKDSARERQSVLPCGTCAAADAKTCRPLRDDVQQVLSEKELTRPHGQYWATRRNTSKNKPGRSGGGHVPSAPPHSLHGLIQGGVPRTTWHSKHLLAWNSDLSWRRAEPSLLHSLRAFSHQELPLLGGDIAHSH